MSPTLPKGPFFIAPLKIENSGVDFLGLRQVNLDMMDHCIPGINNFTRYVRCYSINAWIYWKFYYILEKKEIEQPLPEQLIKFKEKVETLFTWGHQGLDIQGLPGITISPPTTDGLVDLSFASWKRIADSTSLMAAPNYGPSSKDTSGLGFISPVSGIFYKAIGNGIKLAKALDSSLSTLIEYDLLTSFEIFRSEKSTAIKLLQAWDVRTPSKDEQKAFLSSFFDEKSIGTNSRIGRRSSTLGLILHLLKSASEPLSESEIRMAMTYGILPGQKQLDLDICFQTIHLLWLILQVRQGQRLAMECIFSWTEQRIMFFREQTTAQIVKSANLSILKSREILSAGDTSNQIMTKLFTGINDVSELIKTAGRNPMFCIFNLMQQLTDELIIKKDEKKNAEKLIPYALRMLFLCAKYVDVLKEDEALRGFLNHGGVNRISLRYWYDILQKWGDRPIEDFFRFIIENLILSQHFGVAVSRFDGQRQRLRIAIEEEGLVPLVPHPLKPFVGDDRLKMTLLLATDCGLISMSSEGFYF
jgi:hypothetical protein